jgi:O-antigen/teichoic acid export membrane protein
MGELFFGIYFNLSLWYKLTDQTQWGAYFSTAGCVITVVIIVLFAPIYGYMACAWASFACNFCMMIASYFLGQKKFPIKYDLKSIGIYFVLAGILYVADIAVDIDNMPLRLAFRTALLAIFITFMIKKDIPLKNIPYINRLVKK